MTPLTNTGRTRPCGYPIHGQCTKFRYRKRGRTRGSSVTGPSPRHDKGERTPLCPVWPNPLLRQVRRCCPSYSFFAVDETNRSSSAKQCTRTSSLASIIPPNHCAPSLPCLFPATKLDPEDAIASTMKGLAQSIWTEARKCPEPRLIIQSNPLLGSAEGIAL